MHHPHLSLQHIHIYAHAHARANSIVQQHGQTMLLLMGARLVQAIPQAVVVVALPASVSMTSFMLSYCFQPTAQATRALDFQDPLVDGFAAVEAVGKIQVSFAAVEQTNKRPNRQQKEAAVQ